MDPIEEMMWASPDYRALFVFNEDSGEDPMILLTLLAEPEQNPIGPPSPPVTAEAGSPVPQPLPPAQTQAP